MGKGKEKEGRGKLKEEEEERQEKQPNTHQSADLVATRIPGTQPYIIDSAKLGTFEDDEKCSSSSNQTLLADCKLQMNRMCVVHHRREVIRNAK